MSDVSLRTLCFLRTGTRVLLLRRRLPPNTGLWNGVGGKMEAGEDPYMACIREVAEETGLTITDPILRALLVVSVLTPPMLWVIFVFVAAAPPGAVVSSDEGDLSWVEATTLPTLHTPPDLPLLLPRIFTSEGVLVIRADYQREDPATVIRLEAMESSRTGEGC